MKLRLECQQVSRLISRSLDERLPPPDRARMQLHFMACPTCRHVDAQMGFLRRAMRGLDLEAAGETPGRPEKRQGA